MPIDVRCRCGYRGAVPTEFAGRNVMCPQCGDTFFASEETEEAMPLPGPAPETEAAPAAAPTPRDAHGQGKAGFWLSLGGFCIPVLAPVGLLLCILSVVRLRGVGRPHALTRAGLAVGGVATFLWLGSLGAFVAEHGVRTPPESAPPRDPDHRAAAEPSAKAGPAACRTHLRNMGLALEVYMDETGSSPANAGKDLWLELVAAGRLHEGNLDCPSDGAPHALGACDYRGPALIVYNLMRDAPIACDEPSNHPDGTIHVLYRDGRIRSLSRSDSDYHHVLAVTR